MRVWGFSADDVYVYGTIDGVFSRVRMADGKSEAMGSAPNAELTRDGKRLIYARVRDGLYARSLQGDVTKNPDELLVKDLVSSSDVLSLSDTGAYYLAEAPTVEFAHSVTWISPRYG